MIEMEKLHFENRKKEILSKIDFLKAKLKHLETQYIDSNQKFPIGSKVRITTTGCIGYELYALEKTSSPPKKKCYAYVAGYEICCGEVIPILMKAKKDGTISKKRHHVIAGRDLIELEQP